VVTFIAIFITVLISITIIFFLILCLEEKDESEFFHVMVHRVRSPSSIIRWYVELMSDKSTGTLNDKQKDYLFEIYKASERLNGTIQSLATLLQAQANKLPVNKQKTNINALIDKILANYQFNINKRKLNVQKQYSGHQNLTVNTDPKLFDTVLQNIIENAIKHTPEEGNININTRLSSSRFTLKMKNDGYGISKIKDSGGLSNSVNSRDIGFNLYLAKLIVPKLGGKINYKSDEISGTDLSITLPV
jgi:two-component system, OmpR family, sensor histidine kinase ResE